MTKLKLKAYLITVEFIIDHKRKSRDSFELTQLFTQDNYEVLSIMPENIHALVHKYLITIF